MLPESKSGTTKICPRPATSDPKPFIRAAWGMMALSMASDLAPFSHLTQSGRVNGAWNLWVDLLDR